MVELRRDTHTDYRHPYRPGPVALLNRLGAALAPCPRPLDPDDLIAAAGLGRSDDDAAYRDRLRRLLVAIEAEARLHPLGRVLARQNLLRMVRGRAGVLQAFRDRRDLLDRPLAPPVVIAGLQRTGTTLLHRLLACDPAFRHLPSWEAVSPLPPAGWPRPLGNPRRHLARVAQGMVSYLAPDFFAIHPIEADSPEEDCLLFDYDVFGTVPEATLWVPSFSAHLETLDHREAYRFLDRLLRLLIGLRPAERWVLKTPQHLEQMPALLAVWPGARVIWPHRDPPRVIASFCSMMAHGYGIFSDHVDPVAVGRHWLRKAERMVAAALAARDAAPAETFLDVAYADLVADPLAQVRRIYTWLDRPLEPAAEAAMRAFLAANPQHKHGRHQYRLEDFGLDAADVDRRFATYRERFAIPRE